MYLGASHVNPTMYKYLRQQSTPQGKSHDAVETSLPTNQPMKLYSLAMRTGETSTEITQVIQYINSINTICSIETGRLQKSIA